MHQKIDQKHKAQEGNAQNPAPHSCASGICEGIRPISGFIIF